jgi:PIN domain
MSAVNWGEVYHATWRERVKDVAERIVAEISHLPIEIEHANFEATKKAAEFSAQCAPPYASCFAASLSRRRNAPVITADPDFFALKKKIAVAFISETEKSRAGDRATCASRKSRRESQRWC